MARHHITGLDDPRLDSCRALLAKTFSKTGLVVVEGLIAVERALSSGWHPRSVVGTAAKLDALDRRVPADVDTLELSAADLRRLTGFDFHRGCIATFERPAPDTAPDPLLLERLRAGARSTVVIAQGLADPANLGAVARTARALGADLLVADDSGADPYERRAIRASMAHVLCVPLIQSPDLIETLRALRDALGSHVVAATTSSEAEPLGRGRPGNHLVLVIGNEGRGIPEALVRQCDTQVTIPMHAKVDSLNVAAALAVLLWELR